VKKQFTPRTAMLTFLSIKTNREDVFMKGMSTLAIGLLIATAAFRVPNRASGQSEGGWITLLDSTRMGDWDEVGKANWATKDGAVVAGSELWHRRDRGRRQGRSDAEGCREMEHL
jgi:hypothetical protein